MCKYLFAAILLITAFGCGVVGSTSGSASATYSVSASWDANRDTAVNAAGGGYKVYYSNASGFNISSAAVKDVPFVSGTAATSTTITGLTAGTYYFKVVAYSAIVPPGGTTGAVSSPSNEFSISLP